MMEEVVFSRPADELSCIIGNLFAELKPPCGFGSSGDLVICGTTHSGNDGRLVIVGDHCIFCGQAEDLSEVLNGRCPERGCRQNG